MPRKKRLDSKPRFNNNNNILCDDNSLDGVLDGDLEECGSPHHPLQRNAANARERARMRVLSRAFCRLKTTLPWVPADTKLSKLDTLRLATSYIAHLRDVLLLPDGEVPPPPHNPSSPPNLTWPFALFPQPGQPGPEPWISRTASSSRGSGLPRVPSSAPHPSSSSNASSSADDDLAVPEEDGHLDGHLDGQLDEERLLQQGDTCRRLSHGLSGGRLLELQHVYQPSPHQCHPYMQRYVDG